MEEKLNLLKTEYQNTQVPDYLIFNGWADLKFKLGPQQNNFFTSVFSKIILYPSLAILTLSFFITSTVQAKPGDLLFPVKSKAEDVKATITNNWQEKLENRQKDIEIIKQDAQKNLEEAEREVEKTQKKAGENQNSEPDSESEKTNPHFNEPPKQEGSVKGKNINDNDSNSGNNSKNEDKNHDNTEREDIHPDPAPSAKKP